MLEEVGAPYELRFVSEDRTSDRASGVIDAALSGDLEGTVRWTVTAQREGCRLVYDQQVVTHKRLLNILAPIARPGFRFNHTLMMRHGEAGLQTFLAGASWAREGRAESGRDAATEALS